MSKKDKIEEIPNEIFIEASEALEYFLKTKDRTKFKEWITKWDRILPRNHNAPNVDEFLDSLIN
jgi:hypothetical protein